MARDEAWFRALHARTSEQISRYALRRATTHSDAEDAVSETYLVAWRRRDAVPEHPDDLLWLYGVARNALANVERGARRLARLRGRLALEPVNTVEPPDDAGADVRAALAQLPEADAELLRLLTWEGLSQREAATLLETTENAIALRASRARRKLADHLTGHIPTRT
jgi:RNA polymerase sigma-70 factor (ECF subfamily)